MRRAIYAIVAVAALRFAITETPETWMKWGEMALAEAIVTLLLAGVAGLVAYVGPRVIDGIARDKVIDPVSQGDAAREHWRQKTDEELAEAVRHLDSYTEIGRAVILEEVDRRRAGTARPSR